MEVQNACPWKLTAAPNWDSRWLDTQAVVQPHHGTWLSNRKMIHWHTQHTDESQKEYTHREFLLSDTLEKTNLTYSVWKQVGCWQQEVRKGRLMKRGTRELFQVTSVLCVLVWVVITRVCTFSKAHQNINSNGSILLCISHTYGRVTEELEQRGF